MKDITIIIPQRGGAVPEVWEALSAAAITVEAALSFAREHNRVVHVVVEDDVAEKAHRVLTDAKLMIVDVREVLVIPLEDRPGGLAEITRTAYEAGAEVYLLSLATGNRVMLGAVNLDAARSAFNV